MSGGRALRGARAGGLRCEVSRRESERARGPRTVGAGAVLHARRTTAAAHRYARCAAAPLCRTTRALGALRGPRARPARLLLLAAWAACTAVASSDPGCPAQPPPRGCQACREHESTREQNLRFIRESLLAKMGFTHAPNTTGRDLPPVPPELVQRYRHKLTPPPGAGLDLQSDAPTLKRAYTAHTEEDDFLVRTDNVIVFAR